MTATPKKRATPRKRATPKITDDTVFNAKAVSDRHKKELGVYKFVDLNDDMWELPSVASIPPGVLERLEKEENLHPLAPFIGEDVMDALNELPMTVAHELLEDWVDKTSGDMGKLRGPSGTTKRRS